MATFQVTTTAEQDAAVRAYTDRINAEQGTTLTPVQVARRALDHWLDGRVREMQDKDRVSYAERYRRASDEDKARIDSILNQYTDAESPSR